MVVAQATTAPQGNIDRGVSFRKESVAMVNPYAGNAKLFVVLICGMVLNGCCCSTVNRAPRLEKQQTVFQSPEQAVDALLVAVKKNDTNALLGIFGEAGRGLVFSGDLEADRTSRAEYLQAASGKLSVATLDNRKFIVIGEKAWRFPVPIVSNGNVWFYDTAEGLDDLLNRRIGRNELHTVEVCKAFVKTNMRLLDSPPGAAAVNHWIINTPSPGNGYLFKRLATQGNSAPGGKMNYMADEGTAKGFALLAYPARYGESGVMTFIVSHFGIVYEKNLGKKTPDSAKKINTYNPDATWAPVFGE
ncbi:MAG: DUF2950 family protein [bacterium]